MKRLNIKVGYFPKGFTEIENKNGEYIRFEDMLPINIIFDGPPSHESGRFIEVETDDGKSINAGEWIKRTDGLWALRITSLPLK